MKTSVILNRNFTIGEIDERIYGGFIEHLGRAVYGGIYQPDHPSADADGFRTDVLGLIRELGMPVTRYPGGNFVSGYNWEDGTGPRDRRPVRLDLAWKALEPNTFGTDEFIKWCRRAGTAPMMAVNLGTRGPAEAQQLVEYCNFPSGTELSERRRANGGREPYRVKLWCLGNEMDGPWQTGHRTADEYGREKESPEWTVGRPLLEDVYTMEDALLVGMLLSTLQNHADRVKIACLAQSVNVIAPIMTEKDGGAWRQTIFHPFALASKYGRGIALQSVVEGPCYDAEFRTDADAPPVLHRGIPYLHASFVHNTERSEVVIFAANRNLAEPMELEVRLGDFDAVSVIEQQTLHHSDLKAVNSAEREEVAPVAQQGAALENGTLKAVLLPASWNMLRISLRQPARADGSRQKQP